VAPHGSPLRFGRYALDPPRGWDAYAGSLAARHPAAATALKRLLADVRTIFESMYATSKQRGGVPGQPDTVEGLKSCARAHPLAMAIYVTHDAAALRVRDMVPLSGRCAWLTAARFGAAQW
jgi:hypothetical protein